VGAEYQRGIVEDLGDRESVPKNNINAVLDGMQSGRVCKLCARVDRNVRFLHSKESLSEFVRELEEEPGRTAVWMA
jgi:hypothetical protein